jgi:hypothetical protein
MTVMRKRAPRGRWIRLTDERNALDSLKRVGKFIRETDRDPIAWKWVVLALHGALYGFAVSACKGSDYESVIRLRKDGSAHLIPLDEALKRCKDARWMGTLHGGVALETSATQAESIRRLKEMLRNRFEHYVPGGWSIEIHGLPEIAIDVLDVIEFLAVGTFRYQHLSRGEQRQVKFIVAQSKRRLKRSRLYREAMSGERAEHGTKVSENEQQ